MWKGIKCSSISVYSVSTSGWGEEVSCGRVQEDVESLSES